MTSNTNETAAPLKILQLLEPSGGGSGRHFVDLCGALSARAHHVTAIYSPVRAEDRFVSELNALGLDSVHAVSMQRAPHLSDLIALRDINRIIAKYGPFDIIHGHSSKAGALARMRLPGSHTPRVYTPHAFRTMDPELSRKGHLLFGSVETMLGKYASDKVICVSDEEYEHALSLGIPADKLVTIVNGVATPPENRREELRKAWGLEDKFIFGFVGRLSHQKAPERLVNAFASIATAFPEAHLVMVGAGELEADIRACIEKFSLNDRVRLMPEIPGSEAMQAFDAMVMSSRYEAMSYVMLEAAASGKPMIVTNVGGARTVLEDGANGLIVDNKDDPTALGNAMLKFRDNAFSNACKKAAIARRDRYSLTRMAEQTEAVYRQLVANRI